MADDKLTKELRMRLADYLLEVWQIRIDNPRKTSKPFLCPYHEDKHPSMYYYISKKTGYPRVGCKVCGFDKGIFDLADMEFKCGGDFNKQKAEVMRVLGLKGSPSDSYTPQGKGTKGAEITPPEGLAVDTSNLTKPKPKKVRVVEGKDFTKDYEVWHEAVSQSTYFFDRALTKETIARFKLGYIHHKDPHKCLAIIPCTPYYYVPRYIKPLNRRYDNVKGVQTALFNEEELDQTREPVFVVEGSIDAMSVWQLGFRCLATNSTGGMNHLIDALKERMPDLPHLIIIPDNDKRKDPDKPTGSEIALTSLTEKLTALNIAFTIGKISMPYKDTNEMLKCDSEALLGHLKRLYDSALETTSETHPVEAEIMAKDTTKTDNATKPDIPDRGMGTDQDIQQEELQSRVESGWFDKISIVSHLTAFHDQKMSDVSFPTKFAKLNEELGGDGLPEALIGLGAQNGQGKTTLALQIAYDVAVAGYHVMFFSLEQSADELIGKLLSARSVGSEVNGDSHGFTYRQIRNIGAKKGDYANIDKRPDKYEEAWADLMKVCGKNGDGIPHLHILEGRRSAKEIKRDVEMFVMHYGEAPMVIVDQLQRVKAPKEKSQSATENVKYNVGILKDISRENHTCLIMLSMMNRTSYGTDMGEDAFRDSSDIEFTCDILLGLQFRGLQFCQDPKDPMETKTYDKLKTDHPRKMQIKILKNRGGESGGRIDYDFYARYSRFDVNEATPDKSVGEFNPNDPNEKKSKRNNK